MAVENGTEWGLGLGALVTTVLAYFGVKAKKEDPMAVVLSRITALEKAQEDLRHEVNDKIERNFNLVRSDISEIREFLFRTLQS